MEKRKDDKGRILKDGESQRGDGRYQFRYTDISKTRRTIYAQTLNELRQKEEMILKLQKEGIDYFAGKITVVDLVRRYLDTKNGMRYKTKMGYSTVMNMLAGDDFGHRQINTIKTSDAKLWFAKLNAAGVRYSSIASIRNVINPAFQMAYDEDIINKNPFKFKLTSVVPNDYVKRIPLTKEQRKIYLEFIRNDKTFSKYIDEYILLLGTGLRVGELCGLTLNDIDFAERKINVFKQLIRETNGIRHVATTKTEAGKRIIPMTDEVYDCLQRMVKRRKPKQIEPIDGYTDFLLIDHLGKPEIVQHIESRMRRAMARFRETHPDIEMPDVTPHVLRHTFCSEMANAGMNIKSLQYIMGHSDIQTTLNIYTHTSFDIAAQHMSEIESGRRVDEPVASVG